MTFSNRLKEERKRLKLNQTQLAAVAGTTKNSQLNYEKGAIRPSVVYLERVAQIGIDVQYCLTGVRSNTALTQTEQLLLRLFREADSKAQKIILSAAAGAVQSASVPFALNVHVGRDNQGHIAGGDIITHVARRKKR